MVRSSHFSCSQSAVLAVSWWAAQGRKRQLHLTDCILENPPFSQLEGLVHELMIASLSPEANASKIPEGRGKATVSVSSLLQDETRSCWVFSVGLRCTLHPCRRCPKAGQGPEGADWRENWETARWCGGSPQWPLALGEGRLCCVT